MKNFSKVLALSLVVVGVYADDDFIWDEDSCLADPVKCCTGKADCPIPHRRRLKTKTSAEVIGPCTGFKNYGQGNNPTCPSTPSLNADMQTTNTGLSIFARDWIDYTCCNIVSQKMDGIIPTIWLWLQVCTKAMNTARGHPSVYRQDDEFQKTMWDKDPSKTAYWNGPLKTMKSYCPQDLDGGEMTEWMVATFFPVMEKYNKNFKSFNETFDKFTPTKTTTGAVTVLLTKPNTKGSIGHIAMVMHKDHGLGLPDNHDNDHYVSFSNVGNTIGAMITGTKAVHVGFGTELAGVTKTITLYNADVPAMLTKWQALKQSRQMFDLLEWNCARIMLEVLQAGYPDSVMPRDQLWTPERAYDFVVHVEPNVNTDAPKTDDADTLKAIHARQIVPEAPPARTITKSVPPTILVAVALGSFFTTLAIAGLAAGIVIVKMKADAAQQLDRKLANLLISATTKKPGAAGVGGKYQLDPSKHPHAKSNSVAPDSALSVTIQEQMDTGTKDGQTDFEEFSEWAKNHNLTEKQAKMMWKDLDKNHDKHVTSKEWEDYIDKRPNLKWLATRLQSCRM